MKFIFDNIGYIIVALCAIYVMFIEDDGGKAARSRAKEQELVEEAWLHSKENPNNKDQFPLG